MLEDLSLEELWKLFPIYFVDSNAEFKKQFSAEKENLNMLLGDYVKRISHIGSTAIKKVVSVKYDKKSNTVLMSPKKAGKATITCKIKQNGKTYTSKCKWTLLKYQNPFAKFKIGSKDYTKKFNKTNNCSIKISYKARKLEIKMKKGYKITQLYKRPYLYMWEKIKNGRKIKIGSNEGIIIYFKDKEGHELQAGLDNI